MYVCMYSFSLPWCKKNMIILGVDRVIWCFTLNSSSSTCSIGTTQCLFVCLYLQPLETEDFALLDVGSPESNRIVPI